MDKTKIGQFIAKCRKEQKLTQEQLAEKGSFLYLGNSIVPNFALLSQFNSV